MYEKDLALNNLQWLIYHQTKQNIITMAAYAFSPVMNKSLHAMQALRWTSYIISNLCITDWLFGFYGISTPNPFLGK